jgi:hypothetical protein
MLQRTTSISLPPITYNLALQLLLQPTTLQLIHAYNSESPHALQASIKYIYNPKGRKAPRGAQEALEEVVEALGVYGRSPRACLGQFHV